tara:strand:+ start:73 stop:774 length:702 start_codon:yes stop_codon:yes gene_type:complete
MTNETILIKVKQRINKLASNDYDNIESWQIIEAFNKGQVDWCRRNLVGTNLSKTGDEASKRRIDDLQVLLSELKLSMVKKDLYYISNKLPENYFEWKRLSTKAKDDCCEARPMVVYLAQEANVDELLRDYNKKPSFSWGETFATQSSNNVKLYTNGEFEVVDTYLTYYRQPERIQIKGVSDPYTGLISTVSVESEFKDDLVELFVDECVKILAGDLEDMTANQLADKSVETNN